jgi:hypothetical protein
MKKKIKPVDQTEELNRAKWEFIKRNEDLLKKVNELFEQDEKKRDELSTDYATLNGKFYPKIKAALDFLLSDYPVDKDFAEYLQKETIPPAANAVWEWSNYLMELSCDDMAMRPGAEDPSKMPPNALKKKIIDLYCRDAKRVFEELTNRNPFSHLLIGVDLTRNKDVILAEVGKLITHYQNILGIDEIKKPRLRWLPKADELLEVWDLYDKAGRQPAKRTFRQIAKKVGRPLSTVRSQWLSAYEKIEGKPYDYDPESRYTTKEKKALADTLCAKCPHGAKCYHKDDRYPCADYLKIAGVDKEEYMKKKRLFVEYKDGIAYDE